MTTLPGGLPLLGGEQIAGAIGISGSTAEIDEVIAASSLAALTRD